MRHLGSTLVHKAMVAAAGHSLQTRCRWFLRQRERYYAKHTLASLLRHMDNATPRGFRFNQMGVVGVICVINIEGVGDNFGARIQKNRCRNAQDLEDSNL